MTFEEFLPGYLDAHRDRRTQVVHAAGTATGLVITAAAFARRKPAWLIAALAAGYVPAWLSHAFIEKNRPKSFTDPLHSLRGDFVMAYRLVRGKLV